MSPPIQDKSLGQGHVTGIANYLSTIPNKSPAVKPFPHQWTLSHDNPSQAPDPKSHGQFKFSLPQSHSIHHLPMHIRTNGGHVRVTRSMSCPLRGGKASVQDIQCGAIRLFAPFRISSYSDTFSWVHTVVCQREPPAEPGKRWTLNISRDRGDVVRVARPYLKRPQILIGYAHA
jgi:hypothetical protein